MWAMAAPDQRTRKFTKIALVAVALAIPFAAADAAKKRKKDPKPGFNLFSVEQDVQLGQEAAQQIEKEVQLVSDRRLTDYIAGIGKKLASVSQGPEYPFTFKVVAEDSINAFALPGGPIYVHTGLIKAADNEAQLAGVLGHEVGHVVLRHSTNRASKASLLQLPAVLAGQIAGKKGGLLGAMAGIGVGFGLNSVMLKYSRSAENDSDIVGARMLYEASYNPVEMATFFQKLQEARGGGGPPEFFSSHPDPGNRVAKVSEEISDYPRKRFVTNTKAFPEMKRRAESIKVKKPAEVPRGQGSSEATTPGGGATAGGEGRAPAGRSPASRPGEYGGDGYRFGHPTSWLQHPVEGTVTIAPENGVIKNRDGSTAIARGLMAGYFENSPDQTQGTTALIKQLETTNSGLKALRGQRKAMRIGGAQGESVFMEGISPLRGQYEYIWLLTSQQGDRMFFIALISPEQEYDQLRGEFEDIVRSIRFE